MKLEISPDKKLFTKQILVLISTSVLICLIALLLQIVIPLDPEVNFSEAAMYIWPISLAFIFLFWIISLPIMWLWIKNLSYCIEDERITVHKGILSKIQQNIPYTAVTDFMLHRSLYDRFFGLASIRIQTAGQTTSPSGYEGNLAGLIDYENVLSQLRIRLKEAIKRTTGGETEVSAQMSDIEILIEILMELQKISSLIENQNKS